MSFQLINYFLRFVLLLLSALPTNTGLASDLSNSSPDAIADADTQLLLFVNDHGMVRTMSREVLVFSWMPREKLLAAPGPHQPVVAPDDLRAKNYLRNIQYGFVHPADGVPVATGPGVYVGVDPGQSQYYSYGTDFALIQLPLVAGIKFLDEYKLSIFPPKLQAALTAAGCPSRYLRGLFSGVSRNPACVPLRDHLVASTKTSAFRYSFTQATELAICQPNRGRAAFVLFGDPAILLDRMVAFTQDLPNPADLHSENRLIIQDLILMAPHINNLFTPWPTLEGQHPVTDLKTWAQSNLMNCGGSFSEDSIDQ